VPLDPLVTDRIVIIGSELPQEEEEKLIEFLCSNKNVFAWLSSDLGGVNRDIIEHKLDIYPSFRPKKQKLRKLYKEIESKLQKMKSKDCWMPKSSEKYNS
jgi:hypothetical protein